MTRVLVTGGLGFIGSHLARLLLEDESTDVHIVDNLAHAVYPVEEVVRQIEEGRLRTVHLHVASIADFNSQLSFDVIYHLASVVGPAAVLGHAGDITRSIVVDSYAVIRRAQKDGSRLVNISTSEVYGGGVNGLCEESTAKVVRGKATARQEYAVAKLACEVAIENLCRAGQLTAVTIRPFNVSGVRQSGQGGFVLPRFVGQAILGIPLTVFGDGSQLRAFTDARDVARGILVAARSGASGEAYNVGNDANRISIRQLAEKVLAVTGSSSPIEYVDPIRLYGPSFAEAENKFPDARKLLSLGWEPQFDLATTIQDVFESLKPLSEDRLLMVAGLSSDRVVKTPRPHFADRSTRSVPHG